MKSVLGEAVVVAGMLGADSVGGAGACVTAGVTDAPFGNTVKESSLPRVASKPPVLRPGASVMVIVSLA